MQPDRPQSNATPDAPKESVFAKEKTYGEKKHAFIFGTAINFWVNLLASAGFSFWVAHSTNKIKLPFIEKEFAPLRETQTKLGHWIEKQSFMKGIENLETRAERSQSMATLFTLLTPGHFIMIPSVYFGAKYKSAIVNHFDRKHYGDEAMEGPELKARHDAIAHEDKPTLLGAVVSRFGSFVATQLVGRFIGTPDNLVNKMGAKTFRGVDPIAIDIGGSVGDGINKIAPRTTDSVNRYFGRNGYSWSNGQMKNPAMANVVNAPYHQSVDNFSRYVTQDVLYTLVTSTSVHPILNLLKKHIPGLTYKVREEDVPDTLPAPAAAPVAPVIPAPVAPAAPMAQEAPRDVPDVKVSNIMAEATLAAKPERAFAPMGA